MLSAVAKKGKSPSLRRRPLHKNTPPVGPFGRTGGVRKRRYFFFFFVAAAAWAACVLARRCWNLSTRPAVSTNFCVPV